ncbi:MAG: NrsF family protein, partial [Pseudomonadota bacterium]
MNTDGLIEHLAQSCKPVRPLPPPWIRTATWFALAAPYAAVIVLLMSPRPDLAAKLADPRFLIEQAAALLTGI